MKKSAESIPGFGPKSDFGDENPAVVESANNNVVVSIDDAASECPNLLVQEENANLDFAEKFVRPAPTSFTIPVNDIFFKPKPDPAGLGGVSVDENKGWQTLEAPG